jgi:hypothetical protein
MGAIGCGSGRTRASRGILLDVLFELIGSEYAESRVEAFNVENISHLLDTVACDRADPMFVACVPTRGLFELGSVELASAVLGYIRSFRW